MKKNASIFMGFVILIVVFLVGYLLICGVFMKREKDFSNIIKSLREELKEKDAQIASLLEELDTLKKQLSGNSSEPSDPAEDTFRYLAIGNSLTWHSKCDYWWNECGMAASRAENDFIHVVVKGLEEKYDKVEYKAYNFSIWEITAHDRVQTIQVIESMLTENLDLVTLQLSENVTDMSTFASDFEYLVRYIQEKCPNAQLVVVDEFWNGTKSSVKKVIAERNNVSFADLSEIRGKKEYQSAIGAVVYDETGKSHVIDHNGVAGHPGDEGMKYIGEAILAVLS